MGGIGKLLRTLLAVSGLSVTSTAFCLSVSFHQLDWIGSDSSTPFSRWGKVDIDFTGYSTTQYFNLSVNGAWVVQNMGIDSLYGAGVSQSLSTTFDIGLSGDVDTIDYAIFIDSSPIDSFFAPVESPASVENLAYQIGGEGGVDLGSPGAPAAPAGNNKATVAESAKLPNIDKVKNQVQKANECVPGAISNSLKYLQATGKLSSTVKTDIADIKPIVKWTADGAPQTWPGLKGEHFKNTIKTTVLTPAEITQLIKAVNAGHDVELDLAGHAAMIAGVRKYSDGRVELDIFDDNQTDDKVDPLRTVQIINGKVDGMSIDGFVVEKVPEPGTLPLLLLPLAGLFWHRCRRIAMA